MSALKLRRIAPIGIALTLSAAILMVNAYIYPSHRTLTQQQADRLRFVDQIRKQLPQSDQHQWQVYTAGELDSSLVFVCPACGPEEVTSYSTNRELQNNALRLDFKYLVFADGKSDRTTINLRLNNLKRVLRLEKW